MERRNDVIGHLSSLDDMSQHVPTMIPMQILTEIDNARNPMQLTRDGLERAATENQFMNGKIQAIKVCTILQQSIVAYYEHLDYSRIGTTIMTPLSKAFLS